MTFAITLIFCGFGALFIYKFLQYIHTDINRASYYMAGIALLVLMFILYILAFVSRLNTLMPELTFTLGCAFYLVAAITGVFLIRYVSVYLSKFVKEVNHF